MKHYLKNATVVNEGALFPAGIFIVDERIAAICRYDDASGPGREEECIAQSDSVTDLQGRYLAPGVIDAHVHFREPGATHKACIATESAAAALGGVTSFMDMPNNNPPAVSREVLARKFDIAARDSVVNYSFYIGATADNLQEVKSCDFSKVCGVKVFLGSSTGNLLLDDDSALARLFSECPALVAVHCEDNSIIADNLKKIQGRYGDNIPFSAHPAVRPVDACVKSTLRAVSLAEKYGTRLHVLHVSTAMEAAILAEIKSRSSRITAETCVQYLFFCDSAYDELGPLVKCNPAIKAHRDMLALRNAVRSGVIDNISTDHAPHLLEEKRKPYLQSPSGIPLVQYSLPMMLDLADRGSFDLPLIVERMSHAPARIYKVAQRGFIREGYYADLVVFESGRRCAVAPVASRCGWAPVARLSGRVVHTIANGRFVVRDGKLTGERSARPLEFR
ncbi:MAG: dihydroorotase [Bacteroidales bacterium]|nr:dihydroorotase [Bacteroidales bacterium]